MKSAILRLGVLGFLACPISATSISEAELQYERSLHAVSFENVDWTSLCAVAAVRLDRRDDPAPLLERNLKYIFHHKLNRRRFLVAPKPQAVVDRIVSIMEANRRIAELLNHARTMLSGPVDRSESRDLVRDVGRMAKDLKSQFNGYFVESHAAAHSFMVPKSQDPATQFSAFLLESQAINRELSQRLDNYFFDDAPGAVHLDQMKTGTIAALAESLEVLAASVNRSLQ